MMTAALRGRFGTAFEWLGVERAWTRTRGSPGVVVAIVDQGVQADHPLLAPNIQGGNTIQPPAGDHEIPGTHAAGIVAGCANADGGFSGIAPHARILPVRFGSGADAHAVDLAHAIEYAVEAGAAIINLSNAGNPAPPAEIRAIQYAAARNVLVVCAAQASIAAARAREADDPVPNQIAVASVDERLEPHGGSAHGAHICAPSFARVPQWQGSGHRELRDAAVGAAYVSGCAALVKAQNPGWGYHELKEHLLASARGAALLDVANAVVGPIEIESDGEPLLWSALGDQVLRWKLRYRSAYCANAVALFRRHGDEHWRELAYARAGNESMVVPATVMRRSTGSLRIACRESNFHSDEVPLTIR
jgi:subtilisin family serine protease